MGISVQHVLILIDVSADPTVTANFPNQLIELITLHHAELETELRDKVVGSLVLLRNKDVIDSSTLLNTLFPILVTTPSKRSVLRAFFMAPEINSSVVSGSYSSRRFFPISAHPISRAQTISSTALSRPSCTISSRPTVPRRKEYGR